MIEALIWTGLVISLVFLIAVLWCVLTLWYIGRVPKTTNPNRSQGLKYRRTRASQVQEEL